MNTTREDGLTNSPKRTSTKTKRQRQPQTRVAGVDVVVPNVEPIMDEALRGLDERVRYEYDLACRHAPQLVRKETPKARFLLVEDNNPWSAARRLAMYWKFRRECMTPERWLFPMTKTTIDATKEESCLGEAEITLLRKGIFHYSNHDATGPVVVVNSSQNVGFSIETSGRILFYLGTVLEDVEVRTVGVTVAYVVTSDDTISHIHARFGQFMSQGLPVRVRRFLVVQNYEPHKRSLVEYLAVRRQLQIQTLYGVNHCEIISSSHSRADLIRRASEAGIPTSSLPASCGGGGDARDGLCDYLRRRLPVHRDDIPNVITNALPSSSLPSLSSSCYNNINKRKCTQEHESDTYLCSKRSKIETLGTTQDKITGLGEQQQQQQQQTASVLVNDLLKEIRQAMSKCRQSQSGILKSALRQKLTTTTTTTTEVVPCTKTTTAAAVNLPRISPATVPNTIPTDPLGLLPFDRNNTFAVDHEEENLDFGFPVEDPLEESSVGFL